MLDTFTVAIIEGQDSLNIAEGDVAALSRASRRATLCRVERSAYQYDKEH
jgi:hypothetical protein